MANNVQKQPKIANEITNSIAGGITGGTLAIGTVIAFGANKLAKNGGKFFEQLGPATKNLFKGNKGVIVASSAAFFGALIGRMGAKAQNNAYAEAVNAAENAHGQLAQGAGARKSFAEQVKASREESAELGI
jgi:hypothetical protein